MKIAYFTDTYEPQINGVVTSIKLYIEKLRKRGHEVHIFCPSCNKKDKYTHTVFSKKFKSYPEYRVALPSSDIIEKIRKIKPDIIHIHTPATMGTIGMAAGRIFDTPIISSYHTLLNDYMGYVAYDRKKRSFVDLYTFWFFNRSSAVIAPSKPIKEFLNHNKIKSDIRVLATPIDPKMINKKSKRKNKKLTILHVGRLCKEKRIGIILREFKKVLEKIDAKLIITSSGPDEERLRNIVNDLGISKNIEFTGYLPLNKLKRLYSSADIFVTASDTETQGLVVLEAMAGGCAVIARDALGFKDVVKNRKNGLLFDKEEELSKKILLLSRNKKLRRKIVKEGFKTAEEFNSENFIKKIEQIYNENLYTRKTKSISKFLYSYFLTMYFLSSWLIRKSEITINSRLVSFYIKFLRRILIFEKMFE